MDQIVMQGKDAHKLPEWARTSFIGDDGTVYLPCGVFDNECSAFLKVAYDNIPVVRHGRHLYAPSDWLAREYPKSAHVVKVMIEKLLTLP